MLDHRPFSSLGAFKNEWLNAHHHFSFADYYDSSRMGIGSLRVWNDDTIRAGTGFDPHPHRDMEIITYVRTGAISHQDSMENNGRTERGDVQVMSAGSGIIHAEYNLEAEDMTLFQIWIVPARKRVTPRWENRAFPKTAGGLIAVASGRAQDADSGAIEIYQDAAIFGGLLNAKGQATHTLSTGRAAYLVPTLGQVTVETSDGEKILLNPRDGLVIADSERFVITAEQEVEVVLADVAL
jgi:redox-sensitive bicupin YhaK (pirin superfamily)